ncbi:serine/threonine-protein kinase [Jidongwangia harbinensis]|uniref:serine/threonine-protein kinase n=1 Tax=Jidongwangia harbinensis TaxID=2878561 RepID=UPI001CD9D1BE|nr:serine/threonine-protein kinase [Jidongwangia harbinensis]MCA2215079.1 serine/threonine protein kinase [Jidongwangia harbinensis]
MKTPLRPGDPSALGDYQLIARLGEGGMGSVFLGRGPGGRLVAVKVVKPEYAHEDEFRLRFRSEVKRARQVPPFCTAAVLDADPGHPTPYLVVEYVDGPSLDEVVEREGPLTDGQLHGVAIGVATALTAIHGAGVIHRDLKPRNVLFSLGTPKVIDFGIARALEVTSQHTRPDQMVGTVAYMAPERFDGEHRDITPAADVFAWGAVIAYAGTGHTPFRADSPVATAARILTQPPNLSGLTGPLRDLVALALAKEPAERPSAHELLSLLLADQPGPPPPAGHRPVLQPALREAAEAAQSTGRYHSDGFGRPAGPVPPGPPRRRRVRVAAAATAAFALAAASAGWFLTSAPDDPRAAPPPVASAPVAQPTMPTPGAVRGPWVVDALDRPGQWRSSRSGGAGNCAFDDRGLVMTATDFLSVDCPGPDEGFAGDQAIAADVTLGTPRSCATVRFRAAGESTYWLDLCPEIVRIRHEGRIRITNLGETASRLFPPGQRRRVVLTLRGAAADVTVGGAVVLRARLTDPSLLAGRVSFGAATVDSDAADDNEVAWAVVAAAEIRPVEDLSAAAAPSAAPGGLAFTDVRRGRTRSVVRVHAYHPKARSVVVEPTLFLTGDQYCAAFGLEPSPEAPCERAWVTEDSRMIVTLPTTANPRLTTTSANSAPCVGSGALVLGTCRASAKDFVMHVAGGEDGALVELTTDNGSVTGMAEVYTP